VKQLSEKLAVFDKAYATGESRICLNLSGEPIESAATGSLGEIAAWAQARTAEATHD